MIGPARSSTAWRTRSKGRSRRHDLAEPVSPAPAPGADRLLRTPRRKTGRSIMLRKTKRKIAKAQVRPLNEHYPELDDFCHRRTELLARRAVFSRTGDASPALRFQRVHRPWGGGPRPARAPARARRAFLPPPGLAPPGVWFKRGPRPPPPPPPRPVDRLAFPPMRPQTRRILVQENQTLSSDPEASLMSRARWE